MSTTQQWKKKAIFSNQVRIIGGRWRSRKLRFLAHEGLRPTTDAVRETLFNWLAPDIVGARCLDLFAGSGALGFEALSRGASFVCMVDKALSVVKQLQENAALLPAPSEALQLCCADAFNEKNSLPGPFDIVFLDPPFHQNLIPRCCAYLERRDLFSAGALAYIEAEREIRELPLPDDWEVLRHKVVGCIGSWLCRSRSSR